MRKISIARRRLELIDSSQIPTTAELRSFRRESSGVAHSSPDGLETAGTTLTYPISEADAQILESMASRERLRQLTATLHRSGHFLVLKLEPLLNGRRLLSCEQVSEILGVSRAYIYHLARAGKLPAYRIGRMLRFEPDDVLGFLSDCQSQARGTSCT